MSVEDMKKRIGRVVWDDLMALRTKEEIMREYGMLAYVPGEIANSAKCGVWALRQVRGVGVENLGGLGLQKRENCFRYACRAGVDFCIIRSLYESLSAVNRFAGGEGMTWRGSWGPSGYYRGVYWNAWGRCGCC
jgi:hypothetical protein